MSDVICRNTMMRCNTPGMCSPHGGCRETEPVSSVWLEQLRSEFRAAVRERDALKAECEGLRESLTHAADEVESWGAYASDYFQQKHDLAGTVLKVRQAAVSKESGQ